MPPSLSVDTRYVTGNVACHDKEPQTQGIGKFFGSGSTAGIQATHAKQLRLIPGRIHAAISSKDMDLPGLRLHKLTGTWSVIASGNWRVTFIFKGEDWGTSRAEPVSSPREGANQGPTPGCDPDQERRRAYFSIRTPSTSVRILW